MIFSQKTTCFYIDIFDANILFRQSIYSNFPFSPLMFLPILIIALAAGLYMAWGIGANDFANSMSSAVGARALTYRQVIVLGAIMEFTGAVFVGSHVTDTVRKGIIDPEVIGDAHILAIGALAALISAAIWLTISSWKELPVSTTHSIVGGLWGVGMVYFFMSGKDPISWGTVGKVTLSWLLSPIAGAIIAYFVFKGIVKIIFQSDRPLERTKLYGPLIIGATAFIISLSLLMKTNLGKMVLGTEDDIISPVIIGIFAFLNGYFFSRIAVRTSLLREDIRKRTYIIAFALLFSSTIFSLYLTPIGKNVDFPYWISIATIMGFIGVLLSYILTGRKKLVEGSEIDRIEEMFRKLQIATSCYVAFAHGANDVANASGPMAAAINYALTGSLGAKVPVPTWLLALAAFGIVLGVATWGYKVIKTVGFKITRLTNTRGFSVDFGTATTVLVASKLGMPISTTHTVVGAVIGVGLARGLEAVDLKVIKNIIISWAITLPVAAITSAGIFLLLMGVL